MNEKELRRVADFINGLAELTVDTGLALADGFLWDEGEPLCKINDSYEIETI